MVFLIFIAALAVAIFHIVFAFAWAASILFAILIACGCVVLFYIGMFLFMLFMVIRFNKLSDED